MFKKIKQVETFLSANATCKMPLSKLPHIKQVGQKFKSSLEGSVIECFVLPDNPSIAPDTSCDELHLSNALNYMLMFPKMCTFARCNSCFVMNTK